MSKGSPRVDAFIKREEHWQKAFKKLRNILLDSGLTEELKWGKPCYTYGNSNVVLIHGFKEYCALLFMKGALLKDPKSLLVQQTKNVQAARQMRFTSRREIDEMESIIESYIRDAIRVEKAGLKVPLKKTEEFEVAEEFQSRMDKNLALKEAFNSLTPGRQRAYLLHFSTPKLSKTRESRVEKCVPLILEGIGLDDV